MGKQILKYKQKKLRLTTLSNKAIHKKKIQSNTEAFIEEMRASLKDLQNTLKYEPSESSCCTEIITRTLRKQFIEKNIEKNINYNQKTLLQWAYKQSQICQACHKWENHGKLVYCDPCEDVFHMNCVNLKRKPGQDWVCPKCKEQRKLQEIKYKILKQKNKLLKFELSKCGFCKTHLKKDKSQCLQCKKMFHQECFSKNKSCNDILVYLCCFCSNKTIERVKQNNSIFKYFPVKVLESKKIRNQFYLPQPYKNQSQKIKCQQSLFYALESQNIQFSDELIYEKVKTEQNNTSREHLLQIFDDSTKDFFKEFKLRTQQACYGPLVVEHDKKQGFVVRAQEDIAKGTLICEYVGIVYTYRELVFSSNDSIMTLLKTTRSETTLVILPEKYGNIAKFISGVNNHVSELKKKQNVSSIRVDVDNKARVLIYVLKQIKKGELLYYDYNAGGDNNYDTQSFV